MIKNDNHVIETKKKDIPQGYDYSIGTRFLYKYERKMIEGLIWGHVRQEDLDRLVRKLWFLFPVHHVDADEERFTI